MTAAELSSMIAAGKAPAIVDVRSEWEFERGHVPGATHIPFWNIASHIDEVPTAKNKQIVVYCGHGPRAQWAAAALKKRGFENVVLLDGHWAGWVREGRPERR
jgi:rhodanese-related sulfurtransferase